MSQLSDNLKKRLHDLDNEVPEVQRRLEIRGINIPYPTLAAWFNGSRRPRDMKKLRALCDVLETTIAEMHGEALESARNKFESTVLKEARNLSQLQREAVLALIRSMTHKDGS